MRIHVLTKLLVLAGVAVCVLFLLLLRHAPASGSLAEPAGASQTAIEEQPQRPQHPAEAKPDPAQPAPSSIAAASSTEPSTTSYVEARVAQLMDLAMNDDSVSLDTILSELTNRDPQIRKAALEAAIQFGSRDAIPKLEDAASQTDDPQEKAELTEAVEFLKLPSLTEYLAANKGATSGAKAPPRMKVAVNPAKGPAATLPQ